MAARIDTTQIDVLNAILLRLRNQLTLDDRTCFAVARPQDAPNIFPGGNYFLTVAFGDGTFNEEEQVTVNCMEATDFTITAYTRIKTDSTGHDMFLLTDSARGLLSIKKLILKALVGQDLQDDDGFVFLRELIKAIHASSPDIVNLPSSGTQAGTIQLIFRCSFDWKLI